MRTLILTSPELRGDDVGRAQTILNGNNVWGTDFYTGAHDSVYGVLCAQAAFRAHYWLGYTLTDLGKIGHYYGETLDGLLTGAIKLDKARTVLRNTRLKQAAAGPPLRERALAKLNAHLGEKEDPPGSNVCYASKWYGMIGPWCAMGVTMAYVEAGSKGFARGQRWAYVPYMEADAKLGRNFLTITHDPQAGDLVSFDWDNDGISDHVGLFRAWISGRSTFSTIEPNTSSGSNSNGGEVQNRLRSMADVAMFMHCGG